jgi:spermidine synthase
VSPGTVPPQGRHGGAPPGIRRWALPTVIVAALAIAIAFVVRAEPTVLHEEATGEGVVRVVERPDGLRELYLERGGSRQTALYPRFPRRLVLAYTRVAAVGPALVPPEARVLYVGLGGGAMPSWLRQHRTETPIDVVEIEPEVVEVAREYFGFREDPAMRVWVADARPFIEEAPAGFWGLVVLDAFTGDGVPRHLTTVEFLEAVRDALTPEGIVVSNVHRGGDDHEGVVAGYREVFEHVILLDVPDHAQRILLAAGPGRALDRDSVVAAAREFTAEVGLDFDLAALVEEAWGGSAPGQGADPLRDGSVGSPPGGGA